MSELVAGPKGAAPPGNAPEGNSAKDGTIHRASEAPPRAGEASALASPFSLAELREVTGAPTRYKIVRRLGAGGMAEVFLSSMESADGFTRPVALKVVREAYADVPEFCEMFTQEAKFAALLNHPNIVSVLDFNRDATGRPFLAMEYVRGRDLSSLMKRPLPPAAAIFIALEVLRGLGHAHQLPENENGGVRGVVHRDISPQNILLSWQGAVKVADFGIAKAMSTTGIQTGIKGKPSYMSPEQANGDPLDGRSDLFSVGVVLWEMLTGERLFTGIRSNEILARIQLGDVPLPSRRTPVPADLERVTMKLLAKDREQRYASARDAIAALVQCKDAPRNGPEVMAALLTKLLASGPLLGEQDPTGPTNTATNQVTATGAVAPAANVEAASAEGGERETDSGAVASAASMAASSARSAATLPRAATLAAAQPSRRPATRRLVAVGFAALAAAAAIAFALDADAPRTTAPRSSAPAPAPPTLLRGGSAAAADLPKRTPTSSPGGESPNALPVATPSTSGALPDHVPTSEAGGRAAKGKVAAPQTSGSHRHAAQPADRRPADEGMIHLQLQPQP